MKLCLGNLTDLKVQLLNASLRTQTDWDLTLAILGKGVAGRFETYCNRKFERIVGDTFQCTADRHHVTLPRYPLEALPTIALRDDITVGFVAQVFNDLVMDYDLSIGLIKFAAQVSPYTSRLQFTFTGGYWVPDDDLSQTDADLPSGASLVPQALKLAWLLQCERLWAVRDDLGVGVSKSSDQSLVINSLGSYELIPEVKEALNGFVRYAMT